MKLNSGKCHLLVSGHHYEEMFINIGNNRIWESKNVELLGIILDKDLKFDKHVNKICLKANRKLNVLSRMRSFLSAEKRIIILKSFIEAQFKYCPLTWMLCSRKSNNKINRLHERSLTFLRQWGSLMTPYTKFCLVAPFLKDLQQFLVCEVLKYNF